MIKLNINDEFPEHTKEAMYRSFEAGLLKETAIKSSLSLVPLIKYWEKKFESKESQLFKEQGKELLRKIKEIPELNAPITDRSVLDKYKDHVQFLVSCLMPGGLGDSVLTFISAPFEFEGFAHTPALIEKMQHAEVDFLIKHFDCQNINNILVKACTLILDKVHGYNLFFELPMIASVRQNDRQFKEYFKSSVNLDFVEIKPLKDLPRPDEDTVRALLNDMDNIQPWIEAIQPQNYEFSGVVRALMIDVTAEEALSQIKYFLLEKDSLIKEESINNIQSLLRDYFRTEDVHLGISALDFPEEFSSYHDYSIRHDLTNDIPDLLHEKFDGSIIQQAVHARDLVIIDNLESIENPTEIETNLLEKGFHSICIAPLLSGQKVIGILQIASKTPFLLNSLDRFKLLDIKPLFRTSLERSREEIDNQIDSIIREQYTALHKSVEWKFVESANQMMAEKEKGSLNLKLAPIVFKDVVPLYGQADIVGSSTIRNRAIQKDLLENLRMAEEVLIKSQESLSLPILKQYQKKVEEVSESVALSVNSNDEIRVVEFIKDEIYPLFRMIKQTNKSLKPLVNAYRDQLNPELGILYQKRKSYEDSVSLINDTISSYLELKETEIQALLPHYFEKYKTDGVEFDMYVDESILKSGKFSSMHINNMRLWQLIIMWDVARLVRSLQDKLEVKLDTAELVLVHSNPISIQFRMDEKRFDVDGAYNVRYEIIKKRIDKALTKGTRKRLTKAGTVSVIYSQDKDRKEYEAYIKCLIDNDYIASEVEHFELEKTLGVEGLKAFR